MDAHPDHEAHTFFMECNQISNEAQFLVDALPNVETEAVERLHRQLNAIKVILLDLNDPHSSPADLEPLRLWRDVRKDTLEAYRQIFMYLEEHGLLDMENSIQRSCLYLVFQPRIQASLNRTRDAWNHHKIRTAGNKTPIAIFELSRETAIRRGYCTISFNSAYWTGDNGNDLATATDPFYGYDGDAPQPPIAEQDDEPDSVSEEPDGITAERAAGILYHPYICINDDEELHDTYQQMSDFDFGRDDENWGIVFIANL
ncbi:hypothetical protein K438DRAFT_1600950 [Mycena galopus ATCC 62051]|nr:hypothetical protein K438DRAFT_1600950 [Mycena galopus ATCC 62051]